ncbi:MAG: type II secretion system secretin GspD [Pseudomonadota bacterium]
MTIRKAPPLARNGVQRMHRDRHELGSSRILLVLAVTLALVGCAAQDFKQLGKAETVLLKDREDPATKRPAPVVDDDSEVSEAPLATSAAELAERNSDRAQATLYRGNDRSVRLPEPQETVKFLGEAVSLNFEQAPLDEVVHAVMGDILALDYIVDRPLQGRVTLRTRTPIPRDELLVVLESLLKAHDALMIRGDDGRYLVTGSQQAMSIRPMVGQQNDTAAGFSTMIIPLQYISASAMAKILEPLADKTAFVRIDNARSLLMLAGTRAQLSGWLQIITTFDVDMLSGMSVGIFPLENSTVEETITEIQTLLSSVGGDAGDLTGVVRVLPMERLNSILVVTPRSRYLDTIGEWVERLDRNPDARFEKRLYVYPVQNTTAARLAQLLNSIYAGGSAAGGGSRGTAQTGGGVLDQSGVAPGLSPESIGGTGGNLSSQRGSSSFSNNRSGSAVGSGAGGASGSFGTGNLQSGTAETVTAVAIGASGSADGSNRFVDVRVVADDENNALMIYADGRQYDIIKSALAQLDVVATQILIEASIIEVQLTDELRYGLEWSFKNGFGGGDQGVGRLLFGDDGISAGTGFSYSFTPGGSTEITAVLNALSNESLINVISSPSVMVLDNQIASISIGDRIPVRQGIQNNTVGLAPVETFEYVDTGVQLSVRPSVNAGSLVTMDIQQSVIDVNTAAADTAGGNPVFLDRSINSRVSVRSGESVVLGGLIRENASLSDAGVPLLHKIPVVGALFGNTNTENRRTELLVIITPRALANEAQLRSVSDEMREQVRFLELIENPPRTGAKTYP